MSEPSPQDRRRAQLREASRRYYHKKKAEKESEPITYNVEYRRAYYKNYYQQHREEMLQRQKERYHEDVSMERNAETTTKMQVSTPELVPIASSVPPPLSLPPTLSSTSITINKSKNRKATIPKSVRSHVWNLYVGSHLNEHRCLCCKKSMIKITDFEIGHVQSEADGGTLEISNLRPICAVCNHSMGRTNMIEFIKRYGYYL